MLAAGLSLAMYLSGAQLRQIFFYLLGSLNGADWQSLLLGLPIIAIGSRSSSPVPARSTACCWATTPRCTSAWTCAASVSCCWRWPRW